MNLDQLAAHAHQLAADRGAVLVESGTVRRAHAHVSHRYGIGHGRHAADCSKCGPVAPGDLVACCRPIRSRRAYAVALHELGHLCSDRQHPRQWGRLEREVDASWWAWQHAAILDRLVRAELERQSLGYIARYPSWPRPPAESEAWAQIIDVTHHRPPRKRTPR